MPLNYEDFFKLQDPLKSKPLRLGGADVPDESDFVYRLKHGLLRPDSPIKLTGYMGTVPMDFLWSGYVGYVCISDNVVELLKSGEMTGWGTYPVEVFGRKKESLKGYWGFSIPGKQLKWDKKRSPIVPDPPPGVPNSKSTLMKGFIFLKRNGIGATFSG